MYRINHEDFFIEHLANNFFAVSCQPEIVTFSQLEAKMWMLFHILKLNNLYFYVQQFEFLKQIMHAVNCNI